MPHQHTVGEDVTRFGLHICNFDICTYSRKKFVFCIICQWVSCSLKIGQAHFKVLLESQSENAIVIRPFEGMLHHVCQRTRSWEHLQVKSNPLLASTKSPSSQIMNKRWIMIKLSSRPNGQSSWPEEEGQTSIYRGCSLLIWYQLSSEIHKKKTG